MISRPRRLLLTAAAVLALVVVAFYLWTIARAGSSAGGWQPAGLQGVLVHAVVAPRDRAGVLYAGAHDGVYRETGGQWRRLLASSDVWAVTTQGRKTILAVDNDGYLHLSTDGGTSWRRSLVAGNGAYAVTTVPGNARSILVGASGGVYRSTDAGGHWRRALSLPGSAAAAFAWSPDGRTVYAGAVAGGPRGSTAVYRSLDQGISWREYGTGLRSTGGIMSLVVLPNRLVSGTMGNAAWLVSSGGVWHKEAGGMPATGDHVAALLPVPASHALYAGTLGHGVFRSGDGGQHWSSISAGLPTDRFATTVLGLTRDASGRLYAATADGVYSMASP